MRSISSKTPLDENAQLSEPLENADVFPLLRLPRDLLFMILSLSNNPSALFCVNKSFRAVTLLYLASRRESLLRLEPGKTYYTVGGYLSAPFTRPRLFNLSQRIFSHTAEYELDRLNEDCSENILFVGPSSIAAFKEYGIDEKDALEQLRSRYPGIKVEILNSRKIQEKKIYIAKSQNGIRYALLTAAVGMISVSNGHFGVSLTPLLFCHGEIKEDSLPLLACITDESIKNYKPLLDRILAVLESRRVLFFGRQLELIRHLQDQRELAGTVRSYSTLPIFLTEKEAQDYISFGPSSESVIHPCTIKKPVLLARKLMNRSYPYHLASKEQAPGSESHFLFYNALKSNLIPLGASYPYEGKPIEVTEENRSCAIM